MENRFSYAQHSEEMLTQLPKGAFLSVETDGRINTMTIGWGFIGFMWQLPVMVVAVRPTRFTYELLEKSGQFTVSVPLNKQLKKELAGAGSTSGRDLDKFSRFNLTPQAGKEVGCPVIRECQLFYECQMIYKQVLDENSLDPDLKLQYYPLEDYHTLYFGKILTSYKKEALSSD
ncbi:MAG TPA: flavin reductase family protein [Syntrophomonadaceae bacterium]|nr:flavin reductase family protein [Syntrophomonadaceae bacterium]